ncbi:MAG: ADP-ribosylglycohydrolase family protein, partial [Neisseria sp.]|nr:ADP-ribosylglycohydrolase family protein [Neisseria sp.]
SLIRQGGDTDTTAAIFGGIAGVRHGQNLFAAVSGTWCEPLLTPGFFAALAEQAEQARSGRPQKARRFGGIATFARNLVMMLIVLAHGFRRLLPPY